VVLLQNAPATLYSEYVQPEALARWTAPDGSPRTGQVAVNRGARAGSTVPVWTSDSGRPTSPPLRRDQVTR
jgi:hypothetical protein